MEDFEQENEELREEINTLKGTVERLNSMVEALVVAQNRPTPEEPQRTVVSEIVSTPIPQYTMPPDRPWGMPYNFIPEGYIPPASEAPKVTMDMRPPEGYKLWKLKFQEQRQWVSLNRMLRFQDLLSWLLHDRLCILFPR